MRNKDKIIALFLALALLSPALTIAQTDSSETTRKEQQRVEQREIRAKALKRLADTQYKRTENAIRKLSDLIGKIDKKVATLQDRGVDVSSLSAPISEAKNMKAEAEALLSDLKDKYNSIDPASTNPKRQVQDFMNGMKALKKKLVELHRSLMDIVKELRKLEKSDRASSTPTTNSEADNASGE